MAWNRFPCPRTGLSGQALQNDRSVTSSPFEFASLPSTSWPSESVLLCEWEALGSIFSVPLTIPNTAPWSRFRLQGALWLVGNLESHSSVYFPYGSTELLLISLEYSPHLKDVLESIETFPGEVKASVRSCSSICAVSFNLYVARTIHAATSIFNIRGSRERSSFFTRCFLAAPLLEEKLSRKRDREIKLWRQGTVGGDCSPLSTFVRVDSNTFRQVMQRLTCPADHTATAGWLLRHRCPVHCSREGRIMIEFDRSFISPSFRSMGSFSAELHSLSPTPASTPRSNLPKLSPVQENGEYPSMLLLLDRQEEEKAIRERRFYVHPSPRSWPQWSQPKLLDLFPATSPMLVATDPDGGWRLILIERQGLCACTLNSSKPNVARSWSHVVVPHLELDHQRRIQ